MGKNPEIDKSYKSLTKAKFTEIILSLERCNMALAHLAYMCRLAEPDGLFQIPLEHHPDKCFNFSVLKHKITQDELLVIEVMDKEASITH